MKESAAPPPTSVSFIAETGIVPQSTAHFQRRLSELRGAFLDVDALERRIREEGDPVCYENYAFNPNQAERDLFFGTTILYPGKVGLEYYLTRGHYHSKRDRAETYQTVSGKGLALFQKPDGKTCVAELEPGKITYIPPYWAHRSVNTSKEPLVFIWTCPVDAGNDYASLGEMDLVVLERDGSPSIERRSLARG
jgi:glucose-6-phosphate isomerase, archaeal